MPTIVAIALLLQSGSLVLTSRTIVDLKDHVIRIGDVVTAPSAALGRIEIARIPAYRSSASYPRRAIAMLIHRAIPALKAPGDRSGGILFRVASSVPPSETCWRTARPMQKGAVVGPADVERGSCAGDVGHVRYDRARGGISALQALPQGAVIGRYPPAAAPIVESGDTMTLRSRAGAVTVERSVRAIQPGYSGRRVFVRDADGHILSAPIAGEVR